MVPLSNALSSTPNFQERTILILEEGKDVTPIKRVLDSPLRLSKDLIKGSFCREESESILKYKNRLDDIKQKAAGLGKASRLAEKGSKIASYAQYMFAFQQFFQSSYRARQGNVLEETLRKVLRSSTGNVYENRDVIEEEFDFRGSLTSDIDLIFRTEDRFFFSLVRSKGETGGTTAKMSLADPLYEILTKSNHIPETLYTVLVWEGEKQRGSLIRRFWDRIEDAGPISAELKDEYLEDIETSWKIPQVDITVRIIYGIDDFAKVLVEFTGEDDIGRNLSETWKYLEDWDDLWLAYALASLELENMKIHEKSNFFLLEEKMDEFGLQISEGNLQNYRESSKEMAQNLALSWDEESLPVTSPSDVLNYLRDLLLCKMIHQKITS